jgi:predicted alpha/beta superfamily hydrolase
MKFKKTLIILTIVSSIFNPANAQINQVDNVVGTNFLIKSKVLNEERAIQVYLPDSYGTSDKMYPVLYLLDGQRLFLYGVSLLKSFTHFNETPEFIVVGITNKYPDRFSHFSSGSDNFLKFLENDVIQFLDDNFRTSEERLLFGWEYGGGFVVKSMLDKPNLFDAYIASSSYPLTNTTDRIDSLLSNNITFNELLYFSASNSEGILFDSANKLDSILKSKANKSLKWVYKVQDGIEHSSTSYLAIHNGVKHYFQYYPELQFVTFDEFTKNGGITYVNDYYKQRAEQFGFSPEIPQWTKFSIIRSAIRANKYLEFDVYASKFITDDFIGGLRGDQPYEITDFYIDNKGYDKAIDIYKILINKQPESKKPLNGLGDLHTLMGNKKEASKYYNKAKELMKD